MNEGTKTEMRKRGREASDQHYVKKKEKEKKYRILFYFSSKRRVEEMA